MSNCIPCDTESAQKAKEKLDEIITNATSWAKRNGKKEMAIIQGHNCPSFCATDDPRITTRTVLQYISIL